VIEKEASNIGVASATIEELGAQVTQNRNDLDAAKAIRDREHKDYEVLPADALRLLMYTISVHTRYRLVVTTDS